MTERTLAYRLAFEAPVGVFTGLGVAGLVDRVVVRDVQGLPCIPGSTVKGRLRYAAERLLRSGIAPQPYRWHGEEKPACKRSETGCTVCRLFGSPAVRGLVRFGQATLDEVWRAALVPLLDADKNPVTHADAELRPGVAISRLRRTAFPDHLFFDETVPAAMTFSGSLWLDGCVTSLEETFLAAAGRSVAALGARKAAGRGALAGGIRIGSESA